jgi:hypothetical protein
VRSHTLVSAITIAHRNKLDFMSIAI